MARRTDPLLAQYSWLRNGWSDAAAAGRGETAISVAPPMSVRREATRRSGMAWPPLVAGLVRLRRPGVEAGARLVRQQALHRHRALVDRQRHLAVDRGVVEADRSGGGTVV